LADYILLRQAERYLERMPKNDQIRLLEALDTLISDSTKLDIKPLYGRDELRLRVGKYRVLFFEDRDNNLYVITTIKPRGDVYK
jgi:mRNA interferase RelE/StbE